MSIFMYTSPPVRCHEYFPKNKRGSDFFVGDLHGEFKELQQLLKQINFNFSSDRLFATGDLIDRGSDSLKCLKLLNQDWFFSVLGNHELFLLEYDDDNLYKNMIWKKNGGSWFHSITDEEKILSRQLIVNNMKLTLTVNTHIGLVGIIHAEYPFRTWPKEDISELDKELLHQALWGRNIIKNKLVFYTKGAKLIISGHTSVALPVLLGNQLFLDTGAGSPPNESIYSPHLSICEVSEKHLKLHSLGYEPKYISIDG